MTDDVHSGESETRPEPHTCVWYPAPELPDNVAIAGRKVGKQYLYRPGEMVARDRDLERNKDELLRILEDDFGARRADAPPSRMSCRNHSLELVDRHPDATAVRQACESLVQADQDGDALDILRERLTATFERRTDREECRRSEARSTLERQRASMLLLPPDAPPVPKILKELRRTRDAAITHIWANQVFTTQQDLGWVPAIPARRLNHNLSDSPAKGSAGRGVRIAVVDTGMRTQHAWLSQVGAGPNDYEELDEDNDMMFDMEAGHGTFVAGVIRQHAPGATLFGRAAVDTNGFTDDVRLATAIDTLAGLGIDILNLSVGGPADPVNPLPSTRSALDRLRAENPRLAVVAAAGNRNRSDELFYPAALPNVISVGALDRALNRAKFSNYGPWVKTWALGVEIESSYVGKDVTASFLTDPAGALDGAVWSGTSFAAPRVAGNIAAAMRPGI